MDLSQLSDEELMRAAGPISVRNNNPGNIRADAKSFRSYDTPEAGLQAMRDDLTAKVTGRSSAMASRYGANYQPTLANLISTYAPPSENDTGNYISTISRATGLNPNQPLSPQDIDKIMPAMIKHEGGDMAAQYFTKIVPTSDTSAQIDYSALSDEDLMKAAGIEPTATANPMAEKPVQGLGLSPEMSARVQGFNQTVPFGNRLTAGAAALALAPFTDLTTSELYETARARQKATSEQYPDYETTGNLVGAGVTLPVGFSKAIATTPGIGNAANALTKASTATGNFIGRGASTLGRAVRSAAVAAPVGAVYGYGAGEEGSRLEAGLTSAGVAGALGAAAPVAGAALGNLIESGANKVSSIMARRSGEVIPTNDPAIQKVYKRLVADYGEADAQKILNSYASTKGKSLVEAGGARTANLAEGAAQYPSGGAKATEFFDEAVGGAPEKLKGSLAKNVSPSANYYDTADAIVDEGRAKVAPLYSQAYKANQQVESPVISRILETPEGRSALNDAARNMQNEMALLSKADPELTALANEAGMMATGQGVGRGLKLRTLDYVKRSMDDTIRQARRAGDDGQVRRITQLKNGLLGEMDANDATGLYAKARKESGDYLSATDALEQGTRFLKDDSQMIQRNFGLMGSTEKKAYRAGVLKVMREQIENTADGTNVSRMFNKPATRHKLESVLSPSEYKKLMNDAMATDNIYKLRNQITGNSRTAGRQIAAEEFEAAGADIVDDLLGKGLKRTAGERTIKWISRRFDGLSDKSAGDVASILYETDPQAKYKIVKELSNVAKQSNPRGTEAAKKLQAFYAISDGLKGKASASKLTKADLQKAFEAKKGTTK